MENEPKLFKGNMFIDDRGELSFNNDFNMSAIKRFYMVSNFKPNFIRAWHGHKNEGKYVTVVSGVAVINVIEIDDWKKPTRNLKGHRYILSAKQPSILYIPKGYVNGFMNLTVDTKLIFFSTSTLEESKGDDYRYDVDHFGHRFHWTIKER